jgi:hypothetical protein
MSEHSRHHHDENCTCGHCGEPEHGQPRESDAFCDIHVEAHLHDEAQVVSGRLTLRGDAVRVKAELQAQLGMMARAVGAMGGIVGHIKASCETTTVDMYSVTDVEAAAKQSPEAVLRIVLAAIVFAVAPEDAEHMARHALEAVLAAGA